MESTIDRHNGLSGLYDRVRALLKTKDAIAALLVVGASTLTLGYIAGNHNAQSINPFQNYTRPGAVYVDRDGDGLLDVMLDEDHEQVKRALRNERLQTKQPR